jgi:putative SOS response-associated peptidase YedK
MPVILDEKRIAEWLDAQSEVQELTELLKPADEKLLIATPVSTIVNSQRTKIQNASSRLVVRRRACRERFVVAGRHSDE